MANVTRLTSGATGGGGPETATELSAGDLTLDLTRFQVRLGGAPVPTTYLEFELLRLLAASADRVISGGQLMSALWGTNGPAEKRRLSVLVCRLRAKIAGSRPYAIETVRGRGYGLLSRERGRPTQGPGPR